MGLLFEILLYLCRIAAAGSDNRIKIFTTIFDATTDAQVVSTVVLHVGSIQNWFQSCLYDTRV